jgi:hypothetical protein
VSWRRTAALTLAAVQGGDLIVTRVSPRYGAAHLDHLGVPAHVRPALPVIKAAAVLSLMRTADRPRDRSVVGAALVAYYTAAASFHVLSRDGISQVVPAVACAVLAASLV